MNCHKEVKGMNDIKVSVIVPVYNVEKYLKQNIESLTSNPDRCFEYIYINDGSTDGSLGILKEYASLDERIVVIEQKNAGQAAARNRGIRAARGEYIIFVDSDDYVCGDLIPLIYEKMREAGLDVLQIGYRNVDEDGNELELRPNQKEVLQNPENKAMNGKEWLSRCSIFSVVWLYVYRTNYLLTNHLFFLEGHVHEDADFVPRSIYFAEKVMYIPFMFYSYRQRSGSTMKRKDAKRVKDAFYMLGQLERFCMDKKDTEVYRKFFEEYIIGGYANNINVALRNKHNLHELLADRRFRTHLALLLGTSKYRKYRFMGYCIRYQLYWILRGALKIHDNIPKMFCCVQF